MVKKIAYRVRSTRHRRSRTHHEKHHPPADVSGWGFAGVKPPTAHNHFILCLWMREPTSRNGCSGRAQRGHSGRRTGVHAKLWECRPRTSGGRHDQSEVCAQPNERRSESDMRPLMAGRRQPNIGVGSGLRLKRKTRVGLPPDGGTGGGT